MTFLAPLSVGVAADDEIMELHLEQVLDADEVLRRLNQCAIPGLTFRNVTLLTTDERKGKVENVTYEFAIPEDRCDSVSARIDEFLAQQHVLVTRPNRAEPVDIRRDVDFLTSRHRP